MVLALALAVLNFCLTFENVWPTLWIEPTRGLSIEVALLVLALALGAERFGPPSRRLLALLEHMREVRIGAFVFPGQGEGSPLTKNTLRLMLEAVGYGHATPHGLRASFSTWAHDSTNFAPEIIEACLAHRTGNATARAYNRG